MKDDKNESAKIEIKEVLFKNGMKIKIDLNYISQSSGGSHAKA